MSPAAEGREPRKTLYMLCAVTLLSSAGLFVFIPECGALFFDRSSQSILSPWGSDSDRRWLYAACLTAPQLGAAISAPFWGLWTDRWGIKRSLRTAIAGSAMAMLGATYAISVRAPLGLVAALAAAGLMEGCGVISQAAVLQTSPAGVKERRIGILGACSALGLIAGPLLGAVAWSAGTPDLYSYAMPFFVASLLFVGAGLLTLVTQLPGVRAPDPPAIEAGALGLLFQFLEQRRIRFAVGLFFLMELALACYYERLPLVLQDGGDSPLRIGIFAAYIAMLIATTSVLVVPLLQRYLSDRAVMIGAFVALSIAGVLLSGHPTPTRAWISGVPFAVGAAGIYCVVLARLSDWSGSDSQGKISGIANAVGGAAFLFAGLIVGGAAALGDVASGVIVLVGALGVLISRLLCTEFLTASMSA